VLISFRTRVDPSQAGILRRDHKAAGDYLPDGDRIRWPRRSTSALPRAGLRRNSAVLSARSANSTSADIFDEFFHVVRDHHRLQRKDVA
jgi:hypothetical protein